MSWSFIRTKWQTSAWPCYHKKFARGVTELDRTSDDNHQIKGDRALQAGDKDLLGFQEVAERIAISLVDRASEDGLVVGLEGVWGSGKSSLLFLISEELRKLPEDQRPSVINFRPWLIGNRDALIFALFGELTKELVFIADQKGGIAHAAAKKAKTAVDALRGFVVGLSKASSALQLASDVFGMGHLGGAAKVLKFWGEKAPKAKATLSLEDLKATLVKSLRDLDHRFVITIDDVDRLEPSEVLEVLRLVRSVVDLPNVIYLLCYDSSILAHSIEEAAKVKSGKAYIEKIVQLTVMVPIPEPFQLRQWFSDELYLIGSAKNPDEFARLRDVIDQEGGRRLKTPRSVVRALDGVRFFWPPLRDAKADLADLVWLQLIKDGNDELYRWIEGYCATAAVLSLGAARVDDTEKAQELSALVATCPPGYFGDPAYRFNFASQLAGVEPNYSKSPEPFKIFQHVQEAPRDDAIRRKRLMSPDHYRLYFALSGPSHAVTGDQFATMWTATQAGSLQAGDELLKLHQEPAAGSLSKADLFLERLKIEAASMNVTQRSNLLTAYSQVMDRARKIRPFDEFFINSFWYRAELTVKPLLHDLKPTSRKAIIKKMFANGEALGWLTSILRRETFAHGRLSQERKRPESDWIFSDTELDSISKTIRKRYGKLTLEELGEIPDSLGLLFAWRQGGDKIGPREFVQKNIKTDSDLVDMLETMTSTVSSSNRGSYQVLNRNNLEPFLDYGAVLERIKSLSKNSKLGERAKNLLAAFDAGDEI